MANYVYNRVICTKEVLEQYFIDPDPFGDGIPLDHPYISFNRLFGVKHLGEYHDKYGVYIYYGNSFSFSELADGSYEVKFCTRWQYPIRAILRALELSHDTQWFAVEENHVYVSRFYWDGEIKEDVMVIADEFDHWLDENMEFDDSLEDPDDGVWYFLPTAKATWQRWESTDHFARYLDISAVYVDFPMQESKKGGQIMSTLQRVARHCALCGRQTTVTKLMSTNSLGYGDLDFRPAKMRRSTMEYWLEECPHCGYVAKEIRDRIPYQRFARQFVASEEYQNCQGIVFRSSTAVRFYRRYLLATEEGAQKAAMDAILSAAWVCDDIPGEEENAARCRGLAIPLLEGLYEDAIDDFEDAEEEYYGLILADVLRRTGQYDEVIERFDGEMYFMEKEYGVMIRYQVDLAREQDSSCHTIEEALLRYPLPKYIYYSVMLDGKSGRTFYYLANDDRYQVGDRVIVPFGQDTKLGTILQIEEYDEDELPLELDKMRSIIGPYHVMIDRSAPDYAPAAASAYEGLVGLLESRKLTVDVYAAKDPEYEWLCPGEVCLFVNNPYGDAPLYIRCGDDFTLMFREWSRVYEYPKVDSPKDMYEQARNNIAKQSYRTICKDLLDFIDRRFCVVMCWIEGEYYGGVLMNAATARSSRPPVLLDKITGDPDIVSKVRKLGAEIAIRSWQSMLDDVVIIETQEE